MEIKEFTLHHAETKEAFDVISYGSAGRPVIVFPDADSSCSCWEEHGMVDALSDLIESGSIRLFCVDSADRSSWYALYAPEDYRLESVSAYFDFVEGELADLVARECGEKDGLPILAGGGTGALNATIEMLRHPKRYSGLLAMSGTYDARRYVGDDMSEAWLGYSPVDLAAELTGNAAAAHAFEGRRLAFVCGQGTGEAGVETQRDLDALLAKAGVQAVFEYWGYDVSYGWDWWKEEARQLLPCLLTPAGLAERQMSGKVADARRASEQADGDLAASKAEEADAHGALEAARREKDAARDREERERGVVADRAEVAARLSKVAQDAWAERDKIAEKLEEAERKAAAAQDEADRAEQERSKAAWIAGEAEAAHRAAADSLEAAKARVERAESLRKARTDAAEAASRALEDVVAEVEKVRAAAVATSQKVAARAAEAREKAAAKKPAAKKPAAKPATKKPAAKKPATAAKKPAAKPAAKKAATDESAGA